MSSSMRQTGRGSFQIHGKISRFGVLLSTTYAPTLSHYTYVPLPCKVVVGEFNESYSLPLTHLLLVTIRMSLYHAK